MKNRRTAAAIIGRQHIYPGVIHRNMTRPRAAGWLPVDEGKFASAQINLVGVKEAAFFVPPLVTA